MFLIRLRHGFQLSFAWTGRNIGFKRIVFTIDLIFNIFLMLLLLLIILAETIDNIDLHLVLFDEAVIDLSAGFVYQWLFSV